jgi:hypothetical protein
LVFNSFPRHVYREIKSSFGFYKNLQAKYQYRYYDIKDGLVRSIIFK